MAASTRVTERPSAPASEKATEKSLLAEAIDAAVADWILRDKL